MSVVTRQPVKAESVSSESSSAPPPAPELPDHPRDGDMDGDPGVERRVERRRRSRSGETPRDILMRLPAVVALERLPVPFLAMTDDGIILFANTAFADMVGYQLELVVGSSFPKMFRTVPAVLCSLSGVDAVANLVVELRHCEGWTVRARMSGSATARRDDPVVLVTFDNLTERLWMDER